MAKNLISQTKKAILNNKTTNFVSPEEKEKVQPLEERVEVAEVKLAKHEEEANKENARVGKEKGKTKAVVESASPPAAKSTRSRASFGKRAGEKYRSVAKEDDEETRGKPRREPKRTFSFTPLEL